MLVPYLLEIIMQSTKEYMLTKVSSLRGMISQLNKLIIKAVKSGYCVEIADAEAFNVTSKLIIRKYSRDFAIHPKSKAVPYGSLSSLIIQINDELKYLKIIELEVEVTTVNYDGKLCFELKEIRVRIHDFKKG